ncbi:MAG: hypothetical protein DMF60_17810 [Acidobacteria bacterium]|nr:MAG: hypothetical protein DMF60_17810 [Acidobacteriota bacterium]
MSVNDDVRAEIEAFVAASQSVLARKDFDAAVSMMTDDVVLLTSTGAPVVGRESVRHLYAGMFGKFSVQHAASSADFSVEVLGDVALVSGNDSAIATPIDGGPPIALRGPAVSVFRRMDGTWKLARSLNLMAPVKPE